jgi:hypothetical protein
LRIQHWMERREAEQRAREQESVGGGGR